MMIRLVIASELDKIYMFYDEVISRTTDMDRYARWKKGLHPTKESIINYTKENVMYVLKNEETIIGAMAVTMNQGEDYHTVSWGKSLEDDEVAVIHILAVNPLFQGRGIGGQMIDEAVKLAKMNEKKAVRLDALASNTPAHHLYEKKGFVYRGKQNLYAENTGWTDFYFYELL